MTALPLDRPGTVPIQREYGSIIKLIIPVAAPRPILGPIHQTPGDRVLVVHNRIGGKSGLLRAPTGRYTLPAHGASRGCSKWSRFWEPREGRNASIACDECGVARDLDYECVAPFGGFRHTLIISTHGWRRGLRCGRAPMGLSSSADSVTHPALANTPSAMLCRENPHAA